MLLTLTDVLDAGTIAELRSLLADAQWEDGSTTAGGAARGRKRNLQVSEREPRLGQWREAVIQALGRHPMMQFLVMPKRFMSPVFNRYDTGMYYRDHVDFPLLGVEPRMRADLSLTLFLSAPQEYEGGELVIHTSYGTHEVKLPAGHAVAYPSSSLHRVAEVTEGRRLVALTWVQSMVRDPARRELLWNLYQARQQLLDQAPEGEATKRVDVSYVNLMRLWSEV